MLLGSMNRQMNLPALQRIAMEFERENDIMDQRQEMMDDAIDEVTGLEDEDESEDIVKEVLDEIGIDLSQAVGRLFSPDRRYLYLHGCRWENAHFLHCRWERRLLGSSGMRLAKRKWPRRSAAAGRMTRTSKPDWTASVGNHYHHLHLPTHFYLSVPFHHDGALSEFP
jgi:Snf7